MKILDKNDKKSYLLAILLSNYPNYFRLIKKDLANVKNFMTNYSGNNEKDKFTSNYLDLYKIFVIKLFSKDNV